MMILPDTDFKATMLNMLKEIGNDLKIDARNKNCKGDNIFERKKNQTATEIKTQQMNLTAEWTKQRRKLVRWMTEEEKLSRL